MYKIFMIFSIMQIKNRGDSSVSIPRANHPCRSKSLESHFKFKTFPKHLQDIPRANHLFQRKSHLHVFALEPENRVSIINSISAELFILGLKITSPDGCAKESRIQKLCNGELGLWHITHICRCVAV